MRARIALPGVLILGMTLTACSGLGNSTMLPGSTAADQPAAIAQASQAAAQRQATSSQPSLGSAHADVTCPVANLSGGMHRNDGGIIACTVSTPPPSTGGGGGVSGSPPCTVQCGGNGGGGGGGGIVGTTTPVSGENCDSSPGQLGTTNLAASGPPTQTGWATTVDDIFGLKPDSESTTAYAWVYETGNGAFFIQDNPNVGDSATVKWIGSVLGGAPFAGPGLTATIQAIVNTASSPQALTAQEFSDIQQSIAYDDKSQGGAGPTVHDCFSTALPKPSGVS